jgi:polygalacturonase
MSSDRLPTFVVQDIRVLDSVFSTGDDGIVFASGNTNQNRFSSPGLPLSNVIVRNCSIVSKSCAIKCVTRQLDLSLACRC